MGYKLKKPFSDTARADFICKHLGLNYYEDSSQIIMFEPYEKIIDGEIIDDSQNYELEQTSLRQIEFEENFFLIPNVGWYRKVPKGYSSAIESLNTVFNAVMVLGNLPANYITLYTAPDFSNEEQCREEWLVANSYKNTTMTQEQFALFYKAAITIWNTQEH